MRIATILMTVLYTATVALGHEIGEAHEAADHDFPLALILSGVALLLALGSLWVSLGTRRLVERASRGDVRMD